MVKITDLEKGNYWKHMNMSLFRSEDGRVRVMQEITHDIIQYYGNVHGGALAGLLDTCIAVAINQQLDPLEGAHTVKMEIEYVHPAKTGVLWGEGKVVHKTGKRIFGSGEIKDDAGNVLAIGTATFVLIKLDR